MVRMADVLEPGTRVGRYVVLRDIEGQLVALSVGSVAAIREGESGTVLMLPAGRLLIVPDALAVVLEWLN